MNRIGRQTVEPFFSGTARTAGIAGIAGTRRRAATALALSLAMLALPAAALAPAREFDVAGGALKPALDTFIAQSGVQLIYKVEDVKDLSTRGIKGRLAPEAALDRLLEGTRLRIRRGQDGAMVLIVPVERKP
jgi:hypothetical protein